MRIVVFIAAAGVLLGLIRFLRFRYGAAIERGPVGRAAWWANDRWWARATTTGVWFSAWMLIFDRFVWHEPARHGWLLEFLIGSMFFGAFFAVVPIWRRSPPRLLVDDDHGRIGGP